MNNKIKLSVKDNYKFIEEIEKGCFGKIIKAKSLKTKQKVAIKIISKKDKTENELKMISNEIFIMKYCNHQNIVNFFESFEESNYYHIVMEYIKFGELYNYVITNSVLSEKQAGQIFVQILVAVDYLHQNKIAHRDIKLENILISNLNPINIKLVDFGFSHFISEATNYRCGSIDYAAPEVKSNNAFDPLKTDIWSMGVILHILLTGFFPFEKESFLSKKFEQNINYQSGEIYNESAKDLLQKIFVIDKQRITINQIKSHPWMKPYILEYDLQQIKQSSEKVIEKDEDCIITCISNLILGE